MFHPILVQLTSHSKRLRIPKVPFVSIKKYINGKHFIAYYYFSERKCKPKDVTLHLKASSYPVISPENITFPKNFFTTEQR